MEHFRVVCKSLNIPDNVVANWANKIEKQYSSEKRAFHNGEMLRYKVQVIDEINVCDELLRSVLILACIFQYFHFNAKTDNSRENCEEFKLFAKDSSLKDSDEIFNKVLLMLQDESVSSLSEQYQKELDIFKDLDLVILGSSCTDYGDYAKRVQMEYATVTESYSKDRLKMLKTLLMIPFIYSNETIRDRYEAAARTNIKNEIDNLAK